MKKTEAMWSKYALFGILGLAILVLITVSLKPKRYWVTAVKDDGGLVLNDGRNIYLSDIKISQIGDDNHNATIFLLTQMTKNVEVWLESHANGYRVWIGCTDKLVTYDCSNGVSVNDALVKAGLATQNQ